MIVVSDTTPLRYLIELEAVHLLETLFSRVVIPQEVANELHGANTPPKVKDWMRACPAWLEVRVVDASGYLPVIEIHAGEREAALKDAGVDDFIFIGCDVLGVLNALHARIAK